ncbi:peroxiredoxin family protein [Parapedobacter koreensis]|uniref:Peroxiredoxin n=1 Tax=Parapedobacter koreensis TaxID=332977 RepID=A0A1H7PFK3_9SPHI|nr:TlpA disulfide reductase family protein [Parapedobacter koreensis]SEL34551.1 Peroxiredoxin [Parapedobacter koreensis]
MKALFLAFLALNFLSIPGEKEPDERGFVVKVGDVAPTDFDLVLHTGETVNLESLRGQVVVLQFTASWCGVCRKEMPHLEQDVHQAFKNRGVKLIGVDRDEPLATVQKFASDLNITYPLALDPNADIYSRFAAKKSGVTRNVVIDRDGKIVFLTRLFDEAEFKEMLAVIDGLVANQG